MGRTTHGRTRAKAAEVGRALGTSTTEGDLTLRGSKPAFVLRYGARVHVHHELAACSYPVMVPVFFLVLCLGCPTTRSTRQFVARGEKLDFAA